MKTKKTYNGNLNVGRDIVSVDTDINYQGIQIDYVGTMNITSLLPNDYIVSNGNNKIIIVKMVKNDEILNDLFSYKGMAMITHCMVVKSNLQQHNLYVNKPALELWNTLQRTESDGSTSGTVQDWAYLTRNWEDIDFDGKNNKKPFIHRATSFDKEANTFTTTREIRKK